MKKKSLSLLLVLAMIVSMMTAMSTPSYAINSDYFIEVGETDTIRRSGIYSDAEEDGNKYYFSVSDEAKLEIVSVEQDGEDIVVTIQGLEATEEDEYVNILCKYYSETESAWEETVFYLGIHVTESEEESEEENELSEDGDFKTFDQNYTLVDMDGSETDVIKVKLTWEISDINATRVNNKIWDTESLAWVENGDPEIDVQNNGTAKFILENYSSVEMDVTAEFEAETGFEPEVTFDEETGEDGKITLETANGSEIYDKTNVPTGTIIVTVAPGETDFEGKAETEDGAKYGTYKVTLSEHEDEGWCLAAGTQIQMADGTEKNIEDVAAGDQVLTFNHETGVYEPQNVRFSYHGGYTKKPFTLHFDNGSALSVVGLHDLFEEESLKYVPITEENAEDFIGKHFYCAEDSAYVMLESVTYDTEAVDFYTVYTDYNENCIANGMLTLPDDVDSLLNIYEFRQDLTADQTELAKDIAEFGLYEYPENAAYTREQYDALRVKYALIMVGKGLCTAEDIDESVALLLAALQ